MSINTLSFLRNLENQAPIDEATWFEAWPKLSSHRIAGYVASRHEPLIPDQAKASFKAAATEQSLFNSLLLDECLNLETVALKNGLNSLARLKGSSLIFEIYKHFGERHMTDIDLYVDEREEPSFRQILANLGYTLMPQIFWQANDFKKTYERRHESGLMFYIDLHTRLFWQQPARAKIEFEVAKYTIENGLALRFRTLKKEWQLAHLISNWAYQDTFISLSKLLDIVLFLRKYPQLSESREFIKCLHDSNLQASAKWVMMAVDIFKTGRSHSRIFTEEFLDAPKKHKFKYLLMKHLTKNKLTQAFEYDARWVKAYLFS